MQSAEHVSIQSDSESAIPWLAVLAALAACLHHDLTVHIWCRYYYQLSPTFQGTGNGTGSSAAQKAASPKGESTGLGCLSCTAI